MGAYSGRALIRDNTGTYLLNPLMLPQPLVAEIVAEELMDEIQFKSGAEFEKSSMLGNIISVTTMIHKLQGQSLTDKRHSCFLELRNFPNVNTGDIISCHVSPMTSLVCKKSTALSPLESTTGCTASLPQDIAHCTTQNAQIIAQKHVSVILTPSHPHSLTSSHPTHTPTHTPTLSHILTPPLTPPHPHTLSHPHTPTHTPHSHTHVEYLVGWQQLFVSTPLGRAQGSKDSMVVGLKEYAQTVRLN